MALTAQATLVHYKAQARIAELEAEVALLKPDAERLDYMAAEECQIERLGRMNKIPLYRVRWPNLCEAQTDWLETPRAAIDAAIAA